MATSDDTVIRLASMEKGRANIDRLIVAHLSKYAALQQAVENFISDPTEEAAAAVDDSFKNVATALNAVRTAVAQMAVFVLSDGEVEEIVGIPDEDGLRIM